MNKKAAINKDFKDEEKKKSQKNFKRRGKYASSKSKDYKQEVLSSAGRDNDPNWYFVSKELAEQAAQLSFQNVLGWGTVMGYQAPSIMRIDTVLNPGNTNSVYCFGNAPSIREGSTQTTNISVTPGKAGVNLMANKLYTLLSSFTGRTASYAPQDVAMMILTIAAIAEFSEVLRRIFGLALTYNFRNRSIPQGLLRSMGIDVADLRGNISTYRMRFNMAISRINQVPLLENIGFIKKARDVYQRIYMDDPTSMSQIFYYMPMYYYTLDEVGDSDGSILKAELINNHNGITNNTMGTLLGYLEAMINAALESSTLNFIYADLLNMANKLKVPTWQFDYLAENYIVMPEYNQNALLQLHNLSIVGIPYESSSFSHTKARINVGSSSPVHILNQKFITSGADIFCDAANNDIVYNPAFRLGGMGTACHYARHIVDMPTDNPSVEDKIEALRYSYADPCQMILATDFGLTGTDKFTSFISTPDHYVARLHIWSNVTGDTSLADMNSSGSLHALLDNNTIASSGASNVKSMLSQFEHGPLILSADGVSTDFDAGLATRIYGQLQFFTSVDYEYLSRLNDAMSIGLFEFRV